MICNRGKSSRVHHRLRAGYYRILHDLKILVWGFRRTCAHQWAGDIGLSLVLTNCHISCGRLGNDSAKAVFPQYRLDTFRLTSMGNP